ncbi:MAG: hypothetical protein J5532_01320 [Lachnospiraceae bacterium]|nr:hypothetical protein [Lachnospiraceae bacterium]
MKEGYNLNKAGDNENVIASGDRNEKREDYRGRNTVSTYYLCYVIFALVLEALSALPLLISGDWEKWRDGWLPVSILFGVFFVYALVQYLYYRFVKLTDVQAVEPTVGDCFMRMHSLCIYVDKEGETVAAQTKHIFGDWLILPLKDYVGKKRVAGYDRKRKKWIVL